MRKYTLKPAALYFIGGAMFAASVAATLLLRAYLVSFEILMYSLVGLFWGLSVLFGIILVPMYFRRTVIYVSTGEITVHTGLIMLRRVHMKMSAVQYVTRISVPILTLLGFNFIIIRALGASIVLPFLSAADSDSITDILQIEITEHRG